MLLFIRDNKSSDFLGKIKRLRFARNDLSLTILVCQLFLSTPRRPNFIHVHLSLTPNFDHSFVLLIIFTERKVSSA